MTSVKASAGAGERATLTLKPAKKGDSKRILKLLKGGAKLNAKLSVELTDAAGNSVVKQVKVKLKAK